MNVQPLPQDPSQVIAGDNALDEVPRGALALAGLAVGLLVAAWLAMYVFAFLARGPVG